jgi:hypothetical protein
MQRCQNTAEPIGCRFAPGKHAGAHAHISELASSRVSTFQFHCECMTAGKISSAVNTRHFTAQKRDNYLQIYLGSFASYLFLIFIIFYLRVLNNNKCP